MNLNAETQKFVFGMKLRGLRLDKGLSLKDLAKQTGLSASYINEIEKGKKSPKDEKIKLLAEALGESFESLTSGELKRDLQLVQTLLDKKFLSGIPFELFGVPAATVFELLAEKPKKMRALVGTLLEISKAHNIHIDDFYFALLRSYIDMHDNSFPELEAKASKAAQTYKIQWSTPLEQIKKTLIQVLQKKRIEVIEKNLDEISADLKDLLYFKNENRIYLGRHLELSEQIFILARELGFIELGLTVRPQSSLVSNLDSFEQLLNHFSASYFASSLLIPEIEIVRDLKNFFSAENWNQENFLKLMQKYPCSFESFFYRMTQVLPKHFNLRNLFFLRYEYDLRDRKYEIVRELHLASPEGPHSVKGHEHYCARWLIHKLTLNQLSPGAPEISMGVQRSLYPRSSNEFLIVSSAFRKSHLQTTVTSLCIGILTDNLLGETISWSTPEKIPTVAVGETCERCSIPNCADRAAALDPQLDPERFERIFKTLKEFKGEPA